MNRHSALLLPGLLGLAALALATPVRAQVLVTAPAALGVNDTIDFGQLGPDGTAFPTPAAVTSTNGLSASLSTTDSTGFIRVDQGSGFRGNFTPGDHVVSTNRLNYFPITLTFTAPLMGAGANIQQDRLGAFTASLEAFDANGNSLGVVTENGVSNNNNDGSAIFIGILDTTPNIASITFGLVNPPGSLGNIAINTVRLNVAAVPEPGSVALVFAGGLTAAGFLTRRLRRRSPR